MSSLISLRRVRQIAICSRRFKSEKAGSSISTKEEKDMDKRLEELNREKRQARLQPDKKSTETLQEQLKTRTDEILHRGIIDGFAERYEEYRQMSELARQLPTPEEKIQLVNVYEREWSRPERRWHRPQHEDLFAPRGAYNLTVIPSGYNSLDLYKFVTKTNTIPTIPSEYYSETNVTDTDVEELSNVFREMYLIELGDSSHDRNRCNRVLEQLAMSIMQICSPRVDHLKTAQVGIDARCESFWERGGYESLYDRKPDEELPFPKDFIINGDKRRKYGYFNSPQTKEILHKPHEKVEYYAPGELAFSCRFNPKVQIRTDLSLRQVEDQDQDQSKKKSVEPVHPCIYDPQYFNVPKYDIELPMLMSPGYEIESTAERKAPFGLVQLIDSSDIYRRADEWQLDREVDKDEINECHLSAAIASTFCWLVGQAHSMGFTQYNELTYPLVSQTILSNGQEWFFATYQLNTINIGRPFLMNEFKREGVSGDNNEWVEKCNLCWYDGPHKLFDSYKDGEFENWNKDIFRMILQKFLIAPRDRAVDMREYLIPMKAPEDLDPKEIITGDQKRLKNW